MGWDGLAGGNEKGLLFMLILPCAMVSGDDVTEQLLIEDECGRGGTRGISLRAVRPCSPPRRRRLRAPQPSSYSSPDPAPMLHTQLPCLPAIPRASPAPPPTVQTLARCSCMPRRGHKGPSRIYGAGSASRSGAEASHAGLAPGWRSEVSFVGGMWDVGWRRGKLVDECKVSTSLWWDRHLWHGVSSCNVFGEFWQWEGRGMLGFDRHHACTAHNSNDDCN